MDIAEKCKLKELYIKYPSYGYQKMAPELHNEGFTKTYKSVRRLMHELGLKALTLKKMTSNPNKENPVYPYLLKGKKIDTPIKFEQLILLI